MATQLCQKCKQAHPGRACDYDEKGECPETIAINPETIVINKIPQPRSEPPRDQQNRGS
jgi:hypothetical protein